MKKIISFFVALMLINNISFIVKATEPKLPDDKLKQVQGLNVEAKSAILMEPSTGNIIYEKACHEKFAPASVTKIMTMLLAMEYIDSEKIKLSDKVTISENAKKMGGSSMILDTGEIRTVEELLKGIAIASGNDAAVAMGEYIGGSEDNFVKLMNERATKLGMKDTAFKNCTGLNAQGHETTAFDIGLMSKELLTHETILKYTGTYMETITEGRKTPIGLVNHNKLVRFFKGCDGLKTGFTNEAKYCISATATRDGIRMLAIIMGAPDYKVRNKDASMLLNYGFSKYESKSIITKDMSVEKVNLDKKGEKYFYAKASNDLNIIVERGKANKVEKKCSYKENVKEFKKGDVIGQCEVFVEGRAYGKVSIYSDRDVKRSSIFDNFKAIITKVFNNGI